MAQSFVMDGYDVVTLTADRTTMSGHVKMDRSACKIRVFVTQIDPVTIGEGAEAVTWTPRTDQMRLFFFNGVKKSHIDETVHPYTPVAGDYYTIRGGASTLPRQFTREPVTGTLDYWFNTVPYYTYPYEFDPDTMDRTYLTPVSYTHLTWDQYANNLASILNAQGLKKADNNSPYVAADFQTPDPANSTTFTLSLIHI